MIKTASRSDVGKKRQLNQDVVYSSELPVGNLPNLFIIADGMGGHKAGDYASRYAVDTIEKETLEAEELKELVGFGNVTEKQDEPAEDHHDDNDNDDTTTPLVTPLQEEQQSVAEVPEEEPEEAGLVNPEPKLNTSTKE